MRIFLTGAGGFLGAAIATALAGHGHGVTCLVRPESQPWRLVDRCGSLTFVEGDLEDQRGIRRLLDAAAPEAVCHAAWRGVLGADRNDAAQDANVAMTSALARLAALAGAKSFIGIGSQAEYGPLNRIAHESDRVAPTTRYGIAKAAACREVRTICAEAGLRFAWLRVFSLYGPRDHESWLLPYVIRILLRKERPALTPAEQHWDFLHVADAAAAIHQVLALPAEGIFNLGSGTAPFLRETIEAVRGLIDPSLPLGFGEVEYRTDQVMWLQADTGRLNALGWQPQIPLLDGLEETIAWFRDR